MTQALIKHAAEFKNSFRCQAAKLQELCHTLKAPETPQVTRFRANNRLPTLFETYHQLSFSSHYHHLHNDHWQWYQRYDHQKSPTPSINDFISSVSTTTAPVLNMDDATSETATSWRKTHDLQDMNPIKGGLSSIQHH
jgi:hypothetical protein